MNLIRGTSKGQLWFPIVLTLLGVTGIVVIYYTTRWGVGFIDWDSFSYISVAHSLAKGLGYVYPVDYDTVSPLLNFPPMLPTILAGFDLLKIDVLTADRFLNALLFGLSIILVVLTIRLDTKSDIFGLLGGLLFLVSGHFIFFYSFALSESLYLFFTLLSFYFLLRFLKSSRLLHVILTGVALACVLLSRNIGVVNIMTVLLVIFIFKFRKTKLSILVRDLAIVCVISILPFLVWRAGQTRIPIPVSSQVEARLVETTPQENGRQPIPFLANTFNLNLIPTTLADFRDMIIYVFQTCYLYFLPRQFVVGFEKVHLTLLLAIILIGIGFGIYIGRRWHNDPWYVNRAVRDSYPSLILYICFLVLYLAFIVGVSIFKLILADRILLPLLLASTIAFVIGLSILWHTGNKAARFISVLISIYLIFFSAIGGFQTALKTHDQGLGLNRKMTHNSVSMKLLNKYSQTDTIYSNYPWALYLHTGQIGYRLNQFTLEKVRGERAIVALFSYERISNPEFAIRYADSLELLSSDRFVSVYRVTK